MLVYALIDVDSLVNAGGAQMIFRCSYPIGKHRAALQHNISRMDEKDGKHGKDGKTERDEGVRRSEKVQPFLMPQQCPGSPLRE